MVGWQKQVDCSLRMLRMERSGQIGVCFDDCFDRVPIPNREHADEVLQYILTGWGWDLGQENESVDGPES